MTTTPTTADLVENERLRSDDRSWYDPPKAKNSELAFRHSGWSARREKILEAIARTDPTAKRLERFKNCGACSVVEISRSTGRIRCTAWHCHDRYCTPCQNRRAAELRQIIDQNVHNEPARLITLTLKHQPESLKVNLKRLRDGFNKLRRSAFWKKHIKGGVGIIEIKRDKKQLWHSHLHIVCTGNFIPQKTLSEEWFKATGDSFIVDARLVHNVRQACHYVAKYVTKGTDHDTLIDPGAIDEVITATKGTRGYTRFGKWEAPAELNEAAFIDDWKPVCTIDELAAAITRNEVWALALQKQLFPHRQEAQNKDDHPPPDLIDL